MSLSIPAGSLEAALVQFSTQTGTTVSFTPDVVRGQKSSGLSGDFNASDALNRLLAGSSLQAQALSNGSYSVVQVEVNMLPAVKVSADAAPNSTPQSPLAYLNKSNSSGALGNKPILDTPFSITVVDNNEINQRGAKSIGQIFFNDPSVYTPTPSFNTDWWGTQIRGLGVRNYYIDGIPLMLNWGGDFPTEVIDSVSALKGLTGFMYGFGTPGGALSYQLKRPTTIPETSVLIGYRNPQLFTAHVDTSQNLGNNFALRANFATEQGTAYNASEIDRSVASLALDKQFGTSLMWQTTLIYEDSKNTGEPFQLYLDAYDVAGSGDRLPTVTYNYDNINVDNAYYKTETLLASTGVEWQISDQWMLSYQLGFSRKDHRSNKAFADLLNSEGDYSGAIYNFAGQLNTLFTQAILEGSLSAFGVKHEIVGGLGLQRNKTQYSNFNYRSDEFMGNIYESQRYLVHHTPDFSLNPASPEIVQRNVFVSDTIHFDERWQAIAGLRFTDYHNKSDYRTRELSPTLALTYKPDPQTSLYISYVEGLEPGSRVADRYTNAGEVLDATVSKQTEIGFKRQVDDWDYSGAIFSIDRANQMDVVRGNDLYRTQDGLVQYQGAELSTAYQVTDSLNLGLGAIYLDATIDKVSAANAIVEGNTPGNAPKLQIVANAHYNIPSIPSLSMHGAVRYFDDTYTSDNNLLTVPNRTVVNTGFSYDFDMQNHIWTLVGNINNLFNEKYWASGGYTAANVGEERNISFTLKAQF
ncbi:TonB-dependent siderophore receptor [Zhongshania aliphaticivorans]|uniref:TonB-dependent siderophore receptor n=1 Tax=Zhongshania aliphaticivorans TaxID=1470434 RepID=UPI0013305D21|nr:TonB-dependent receptor [Zhongshania aliphaticivorans]